MENYFHPELSRDRLLEISSIGLAHMVGPAGVVGDGVDLGVPPPAEDGRFLLRQQGLDFLRLLRLGLGADQTDGGAGRRPCKTDGTER